MSYLMRLVQEEGLAFSASAFSLTCSTSHNKDWLVPSCAMCEGRLSAGECMDTIAIAFARTWLIKHTNCASTPHKPWLQSHRNLSLTWEYQTYCFDTENKLYARINPQSSLHLQWVCSELNNQTQDLSDTFAWYLKDHHKDIVSDEHRRRYILMSRHC